MKQHKIALQSKLLIDNPIYMDAVNQLHTELFDKWANSEFDDHENREQLYRLMVALGLITSKLDGYAALSRPHHTHEYPN